MTETVEDAITMDDVADVSATEAAPKIESDSSPAPEGQQEEKTDAFQERINKVTAQKYEQQRRADALEAELQAIRAKQSQPVVPSTPELQPPSVPEDYDYNPEAKAKYDAEYVTFNRKVAETAAQAAARAEFERQQEAARSAEQQAKTQQTVSKFVENAIRDGVDTEKLRAAENTLVQSGITPELGSYLMNDANGGKIVEFLHDNPAIMHDVLSLDPVSAGIKIANEVKPQALSLTPKVTNAPDPIPDISGGGVIDKDDFERANPGTQFI